MPTSIVRNHHTNALAVVLAALGCRSQPQPTVTPSAEAPVSSASSVETSAATKVEQAPASAPVDFVIEDVLASSRGPVAMGKVLVGSIEVDDELVLVDSDPPIVVHVVAVEAFRRPVADPAAGIDVGLLLLLPEGVGLERLARGAVLRRAARAHARQSPPAQ